MWSSTYTASLHFSNACISQLRSQCSPAPRALSLLQSKYGSNVGTCSYGLAESHSEIKTASSCSANHSPYHAAYYLGIEPQENQRVGDFSENITGLYLT